MAREWLGARGQNREGVSPSHSIPKDRLPIHMDPWSKHDWTVIVSVGVHQLAVHQLAVLAVSFEHASFMQSPLGVCSQCSRRTASTGHSSTTHMMVCIHGRNLTEMTPKRPWAWQVRLTKLDPSWRETRVWTRDVVEECLPRDEIADIVSSTPE